MKVCVTASDKDLDAQLDPRFGRCRFFIIVDVETLEFEAIDNVAVNATHGAGIQAAQIVIEKGVDAIITGHVGPNAYQVLSTAGMNIMTGVTGTVKEAIEQYKRGNLQSVAGSTVPPHFGVGTGRGMGRGRGGRTSMKTGFPPEAPRSSQESNNSKSNIQKPEEELAALEESKEKLEEDLEGLKARIKELKNLTENDPQKD